MMYYHGNGFYGSCGIQLVIFPSQRSSFKCFLTSCVLVIMMMSCDRLVTFYTCSTIFVMATVSMVPIVYM